MTAGAIVVRDAFFEAAGAEAGRQGRSVRAGRVVEWDAAAEDYAANRAPFPDDLVDLLRPLGVGRAGEHLVDVGTGVGTPALQFARRGTRVTGVDPAEAMLAVATRRARDEGLDFTPKVGTAESTGLDDACADSITAGQSWHWYDQPASLTEFRRLLRPGGRFAICAWDWIGGLNPFVDATLDVLREHNPEVVETNPLQSRKQRRHWRPVLLEHGWEIVGDFRVQLNAAYTPETWRGRLRASTWVNATLAPAEAAVVDRALERALDGAPGELLVPHWLVVMVAEPGA